MDTKPCHCGGIMFGDGYAHTRTCPAFEGDSTPPATPEPMKLEGYEGYQFCPLCGVVLPCQAHGRVPQSERDDIIEQLEQQIASLTQERDEEAKAFKRAAKDRDISLQKRVALEAEVATLRTALEQADAVLHLFQVCYPAAIASLPDDGMERFNSATKATRAALTGEGQPT